VRNRQAEELVRMLWRSFQRDGIPGVLAFAAPDAEWRPHSAGGRSFASTDEYRAALARLTEAGDRVEARGLGLWSHDDVAVVRGRMRIRRRGEVEDSRMYWLFAVRGDQVVRVASSPDLAGLLRDAGLDDPVLARDAFLALHEDAGLEERGTPRE
jgi:ketosteroid isomerase-like protein